MKTILTLTMNPAIDLSCTVDAVSPDAKLRVSDVRREAGGGGINVSHAIRELGGRSTAAYPAGGATGDMLEGLLRDARVPQHRIRIAAETRENISVLEESNDQQFRFVMPGPPLTAQETERCLDELFDGDRKIDYLVASGSLPPDVPSDFYGVVAARARAGGARVILDTSEKPLRLALEEGVYLVKPNLRELGHLAGREIQDDKHIEEVARRLIDAGKAEFVVTSLGAGGALLIAADRREHIPTPTVPIRSKVGAGDSMVAGIVLKLAEGRPIHEAVWFGVAAGAAAVMTPGTMFCRKEDVERLYRRIVQRHAAGQK